MGVQPQHEQGLGWRLMIDDVRRTSAAGEVPTFDTQVDAAVVTRSTAVSDAKPIPPPVGRRKVLRN